ncbi:MAG: ABC transporter ATP-binding protein [Candidatus Promineifilaceae bacterium]
MSSLESNTVLSIEDLTIAYRHDDSWIEAVRDFSLSIEVGQTYGLVGESGSGKTTIALAIMRYLSAAGQIRNGKIEFAGQDLLALDDSALENIWGRRLTLVPQDPLSSLNPSIPIGEQLAEPLRHHLGQNRAEAHESALTLLTAVRVPDPDRVFNSYPHQISGGMQQRVLIAMAFSTEPELLVLDEPTTALDVTTQAVILDLFRDLIHQHETAALYVTHNLGVIARICDRVAVLYASELVEDASIRDLFRRPLHPYTQGLLDSIPKPGDNKNTTQLQAIRGQIPSLADRPEGCVFAPRCAVAIEICHQERPPLDFVNDAIVVGNSIADSRRVRCHRWPEILSGEVSPREPRPERSVASARPKAPDQVPVLDVEDLRVSFDLRRSLSQVLARTPAEQVKAVGGITISIPKAKTLGLVGESGSGKTSLARAVIGLEASKADKMRSLDFDLPSGLSGRTRDMMRQLQIVFQNPEEALNPYRTVGATLRRPLLTLRKMSRKEADEEVLRLLDSVRLPAGYAQRRPDQLSGGEKQRVAIARAFAASPDLLIADEPVSALDVSVQASILNLLGELQERHGIGNLFISHDLAVVGYLADEIAVIYAGYLMELTKSEELYNPPHHPYTEALLSAIPQIDPEVAQEPIYLEGEVPDQVNVPGGCPFHPRCPRYRQMKDRLGDLCPTRQPPWQETQTGKRIFCHIPTSELKMIQESS